MNALGGNAVNVAVQPDGKLGLVGVLALPALTASHFACVWVAYLALCTSPVSLVTVYDEQQCVKQMRTSKNPPSALLSSTFLCSEPVSRKKAAFPGREANSSSCLNISGIISSCSVTLAYKMRRQCGARL
jgi:hypothetical protein